MYRINASDWMAFGIEQDSNPAKADSLIRDRSDPRDPARSTMLKLRACTMPLYIAVPL